MIDGVAINLLTAGLFILYGDHSFVSMCYVNISVGSWLSAESSYVMGEGNV